MKTSELKRILSEDCVVKWWEIDDAIYGLFWTVWEKEQRLEVCGFIPLDVLNVLGKYHNTPLNEREDEKKYRIELAEICEGVLSREGMSTKIYSMSSMIKSTESTKIIFKEIFTQQEIDNFPAEIKGAIECGFLRKVEVE